MIPRIKNISALDDFLLFVEFDDEKKVLQLDTSRTCVYWYDEIDLPSDSIYEYGINA